MFWLFIDIQYKRFGACIPCGTISVGFYGRFTPKF